MKKYFFVLLLYLIIAVVYTYPLAFKLGSSIYGYAGDNLGAIHYFWWWKYATLQNLDVRDSFLEQAPFGYRIDSEPGSVFYYWPLKILTLVSDAASAYNILLLLSFPLSALAFYLLAKWVTSNQIISFWAGFAYSFSPYHFWKAYNHLDLSFLWGPPLALFFLLKLVQDLRQDRRFWRNAIFTSLALAGTILTNLYYGYFLLLTLALVFLFSFIFFRLNLKKFIISGLAVLILSFSVSFPFLFASVKNALLEKGKGESLARQVSYQRPVLDLVSLSARPWDYLMPSQDNPWLGTLAKKFYAWVVTKGADFKVVSGPVHERTIFLGFVSLAGLLLAVSLLFRSKEFRKNYGRPTVILILSSLSLFVISMPPYIFLKGTTFYLPGYFLYQIAPTFRTYSRLGIFVLMLVVLTASLAASYLSKKLVGKLLITFYLLLFIFSAFEFANIPPSKVEALKMPQGLDYISKQTGDFNFVVYPKEFNVADLLVFQPQFKKGFLNFHSQSPYYKLWEDLGDFRNPKAVEFLSALGIEYAVFQKELIFPTPNPVDDLWYTRALRGDLGTLNAWFKPVADFKDSAVFQVKAPPVGLVVVNEGRIDIFPKGSWLWQRGENKIYFRNLGEKRLKVNVFLSKGQEGGSVTKIKYNGVWVSETEGGFWLKDLKPENFLSSEGSEGNGNEFIILKAEIIL